jgi:hypothetical protein
VGYRAKYSCRPRGRGARFAVSNDPTIEMMSPEERTRLRKQMSEQAVKLAVSGRWDDAASLKS